MVGTLVPEATSCEMTQLFVNQWDELSRGLLIAGRQLVE
jgi:hypothetical protein